MSSRYPPLSGFNPRDRSPQRFGDRRPPAGPRGSDDAGPPPLGREPPRGPKALIDPHPPRGGHYGGRGRGYGRGDFRDRDRDLRDRDRDRDRDFRDIRDGPPPFRRDLDRDWVRRDRDFDHRDSRVGFGRGRSRSPPPRDFRDMRESLGRDPDLLRMRRGSRDSLMSTSSAGPDGPPMVSHHPRSGPMRGRGRGDWDGGRGRGGRMPYLDDRDSFRRRSRSRDGWWDRDRERERERDRDRDRERIMDIRDRERERERDREQRERDRDRDRERDREQRERERDRDRDRERERDLLDRRDRERDRELLDRRAERFDRRDEPDRRLERDDRDRPAELWKRDRPPSRTDTRIPSLSTPSSLPHHPPQPSPTAPPLLDRNSEQQQQQQQQPLPAPPEHRDVDRPETLPPRPEPPKDVPPPVKRSPPPSAPQVPAFGSLTVPIHAPPAVKSPGDPPSASLPGKLERARYEYSSLRPPMPPPTGPKAERGAPLQPPLELRVRRDDGPEALSRMDTNPRPPKPHGAPVGGPKLTPDLSPPTAPAAMATSKHGGTTHPDTMPSTKPGPPSPVFERGAPPSARGTSPGPHTSPHAQYSSIPTGPRALQQRQPAPLPPRGPPKGSKQWVRPGYSHPPLGPHPVAPPKRGSFDFKERSLSASEESRREPPAEDSDQELEAGEIAPTKEPEPPSFPAEPPKPPKPIKPIRELTPPPRAAARSPARSPVKSPTKVSVQSPVKSSVEPPVEPPVQKTTSYEMAKPDEENRGDALIPDFGGSSEEEDEENIVFTQEYLEERKRIFEKDMQALRTEMPPPPLEDPTIVALLMQIQLLGIIVHDVPERGPTPQPAPKPTPEPASDLAPEPAAKPSTKPSVPPEPEPEPEPEPAQPMDVDETREMTETPDKPLDENFPEKPDEKPAAPLEVKPDDEPPAKVVLDSLPAANAISVESLPFLNTGPPTPISDLDVYQENAANFQSLRETFQEELKKRHREISRKNAALQDEYMSIYKPWRLEIWDLDNEKGRNTITPGPTPPPPPPPLPIPATTAEARRYKGNSELDFQNALRASEISAQEELERRRGSKITARPDPNREATIPDMLEPSEAKARIYKDTNNGVPVANAMDVFGFFPPPNDFTPAEHEKFTNAFMAYPKKWGKIAESLPGRDYQQCIIHYYLTKEEIKYKAKLNKRWSRRGRAKRSARPKSNALMADLGVVKPDYEGEEEPAPVTDTGRPRRAAAPTFGDLSAEIEPVTNGRRGHAVKDAAEQPEKPASRRGRTGPGSRGGRRGKAAQHHQLSQPPSQPPTPQELPVPTVVIPAPPPIARLPKREVAEPTVEVPTEAAMSRPKEPREREQPDVPPPVPRGRAGRMRQRDGMYVFESTEPEAAASTRAPEVGGYGSMQPTSYWSVPEQRDFPLLLAHFGRDFEGISNFMKTKTTVMVKNYFQRRIDSGQEFEEIVAEAERKKAHGESTGPLPVPSVPPKRRYEATPSSIVPRPLAPHTDSAEQDKNKPPGLSSQPTLHARAPAEKERNVTRFPPLAQAGAAPMTTTALLNDDPRTARAPVGLPPRAQGPKMGFFTEERREPPATVLSHAAPRVPEAPISARQTPMPVPEMARMEHVHHPQSLRPSTVDLHGSPLLTAQNTAPPPPQPSYMHSQPQSLVSSHSRHPSLGKPPGSPVPPIQRLEPEVSPIRRESLGPRPLYPLPSQPASIPHPPGPALSPPKELSRPSSTPAEPPPEAPPRQVPAKRSNIMSILNDEPEEPQPRKRFASEQVPSTAAPSTVSPSRPVYTGMSSFSQAAPPPRQEERPPTYAHPATSLPPSRSYSDYQPYQSVPASSGAPASNDWMARFDPRGQQQQQQPQPPPQPLHSRPPSTLAPPQGPYSPYASTQSQSGPSLTNLTAPSPAPTPSPAAIQRPSYQPPLYTQSPGLSSTPREVPSQGPIYRQSAGSPPPRNSSMTYGSRQGPPTPIQSSTSLLNMASRQPSSAATPYGSTATTPTPTHLTTPHLPGGHQTYQQHMQPMISGAQQQAHRSALGLASGQYGHSTPPPPAAASRPTGPPPPLSLGRSYTPPAVLQPNPGGGLSYAPGGPSPVVGAVHPLHARHSGAGTLTEAPPGPPGRPSHHHRVYSQGSSSGLPGPR